ncbi:MAG TPA: hypothetical protein VK422_09895 [Pyrinomonadaceae bacterium]|nr:hypothetical protein [Pyrinomonadaceae bacterium]
MSPQDRADRLRSLREEIAALRAVKCRMSHERVVRAGEHMLPVASRLPGVVYRRVGLCDPEVRARMLGCSHTAARIRLKEALKELDAAGRPAASLAAELNLLDNEIHLLDHRKGEAEKALARAIEEAHRAGGRDEDWAAAQDEARELEPLHDGYVKRVEALRDRVVAELDGLIRAGGIGLRPEGE